MNNENSTLNEKLHELVQEYRFVNPKITISDICTGGFMSICKKILIEEIASGNNRKSLNLFLKLARPHSGSTIPIRFFFKNEINMYTKVLPAFLQFQKEKGVDDLFDCYPKCFKHSLEMGNEFLILNDLTKMGYKLWDKKQPMTVELTKFCFQQFAKFHALSFVFVLQKPEIFEEFVKLVPTVNYGVDASHVKNILLANLNKAFNCLDPITDINVYTKFKKFVEEDVIQVIEHSGITDNPVIIHGDCSIHNVMFECGGSQNMDSLKRMSFLDWQGAKCISPVIDLALFFYANGPQEAFDNFEYFLKFYHDALSSATAKMDCNIDNVFPYSKFRDNWKDYSRYGLLTACTYLSVYNSEIKCDRSECSYEDMYGVYVVYDEQTKHRIRGIIYHFINNELI